MKISVDITYQCIMAPLNIVYEENIWKNYCTIGNIELAASIRWKVYKSYDGVQQENAI